MQAQKPWLLVMLCAVLAATFAFPALPAQAQGGGQNLLIDGDFEAPPTWPMQDGIGEVQVAPGWRAWYLDTPPDYVKKPTNCGDSPDYAKHCYWMRPEFRDNVAASFENRVHGGVRSQKYFSYGRMHEAGLYQQVGGIRPGTTLRFAISIQAWQCYDIDKCGKNGTRSDAPADMHLRVGIDPYGGTNPFSPNIVWSPEQEAFDRWVEFEVKAVARADTVTVFTHSRPEWTWARMSNDVYLDDASLTVVDGRASSAAPAGQAVVPASPVVPSLVSVLLPQWKRWDKTLDDLYLDYRNLVQPIRSSYAAPAAPAPAAAQTLTPTVTTASDGKRTYTVVQGDTLYLIAQRFNTTIEALMQANQITDADTIYWGLTLIIP